MNLFGISQETESLVSETSFNKTRATAVRSFSHPKADSIQSLIQGPGTSWTEGHWAVLVLEHPEASAWHLDVDTLSGVRAAVLDWQSAPCASAVQGCHHGDLAQPFSNSGTEGDRLIFLGLLHSEKCVHNCPLPLRVTRGLFLTVLLRPGFCPGRRA